MKNKIRLIDYIMDRMNLDQKMAGSLLLRGDVLVNDNPVTSGAVKVSETDQVRVRNLKQYVSRGAFKLFQAIRDFGVPVQGRVCIDAGSSTGGFTQVLLEAGAKLVYAVDCGTNQLDYSLRNHPRVRVFENTRIQELHRHDLESAAELGVMDISFSSSLPLIPLMFEEFKISELVVLIKPQFEYDYLRERLGLPDEFDGIIRDDQVRMKIIDTVKNDIRQLNLIISAAAESETIGTKGNREYLFYVKK